MRVELNSEHRTEHWKRVKCIWSEMKMDLECEGGWFGGGGRRGRNEINAKSS